jgi:hypothetical protein
MSSKNEKKDFFELLYLNDEEKVRDFIFSEGKKPKVVAPIMFIKEDEIVKENN